MEEYSLEELRQMVLGRVCSKLIKMLDEHDKKKFLRSAK